MKNTKDFTQPLGSRVEQCYGSLSRFFVMSLSIALLMIVAPINATFAKEAAYDSSTNNSLVIESVLVSQSGDTTTLTIRGRNLGGTTSTLVELIKGGGLSFDFTVVTPGETEIIATHSSGVSDTPIAAGDYLLHLATGVGLAHNDDYGLTIGAVGPQGAKGDKGDKGDVPGPQGKQGEQGPKGDDGLRGPRGLQGEVGPRGMPGEDGTPGMPGDQGPQGKQGPAGHDGMDGADGLPGHPGEQGLPGMDGADGLDGAQGLQGKVGPEGPSGSAAECPCTDMINAAATQFTSLTLTNLWLVDPANCVVNPQPWTRVDGSVGMVTSYFGREVNLTLQLKSVYESPAPKCSIKLRAVNTSSSGGGNDSCNDPGCSLGEGEADLASEAEHYACGQVIRSRMPQCYFK